MPKTEMLINDLPGEECRIAVVQDGRLEEFYQERASLESHVGSIFKGRVTNVEPAIQAAFVDFGLPRHGFLHISDVHPMYFPGDKKEETETVGLKTPRRERPPIQKCFRRGQEILVQVIKEGIGTKGPTVTSYLSIPGRFLVMMPHMERLGVSRKVEDDEARRAMRKLLDELGPPQGFGFIIRTAGIGRTKADLKRDLAYLQRLWKAMETRRKDTHGVGELYTESDLLIRTLRDIFTTDIQRVIVDDPAAARRARDFLAVVSPRATSRVALYRDPIPLFHRYDIERQIETINSRSVALPSGGSLVIDSAEALVAIDVNSGKSRQMRDADATAYRTNLEAADEVCRQLRLRDLGGVVVIDLIDMRQAGNRRDVEHRFKENLKRDRARTRTLPISPFGILEMTRQRMRPSILKSTSAECPHCLGRGRVKTLETVVLDVMRRLSMAMQWPAVTRVDLTVSPDVAFLLLNRRRSQLVQMEQRFGKSVLVKVNPTGPSDFTELTCFDERSGVVDVTKLSAQGEPELESLALADAELEEMEEDEIVEATKGVAEEAEAPVADAALDDSPADEAPGWQIELDDDDVIGETAEVEPPSTRSDRALAAAGDGGPVPRREAVPAPAGVGGHKPVDAVASGDDDQAAAGPAAGSGSKRRRRRRGRRGRGGGRAGGARAANSGQAGQPSASSGQRSGGGQSAGRAAPPTAPIPPAQHKPAQVAPPQQPARPPQVAGGRPDGGQPQSQGQGQSRRRRRRRGGRRHHHDLPQPATRQRLLGRDRTTADLNQAGDGPVPPPVAGADHQADIRTDHRDVRRDDRDPDDAPQDFTFPSFSDSGEDA